MSRVPQSATRFAASAKNRRASALLALGLAFAMPGLASACRCLDPGPAAPACNKASVVLTGTVLRCAPTPTPRSPRPCVLRNHGSDR